MAGLYSDFQWNYFSTLPEGRLRTRAESFMLSVDWQALLDYAAAVNAKDAMACRLLPHVGLGYNHMVRIIRFDDNIQWIARLRLPSLKQDESSSDVAKLMEREVSTIKLVRRKTKIPVPEIYAYEINGASVKAPFMLMQCFDGNVGMDLGMKVPLSHQEDFFKGLANIQVELSTIQLPLIGTIQKIDEDGTILQGPIPGLGGPFATATEFFRAWCTRARFGGSIEQLRRPDLDEAFATELIFSIESFPTKLAKLADHLSIIDKGPFPLVHGDFGHNNVVVNNHYEIIGVIDWEMAYAAPWEVAGDFPLTLSTIPPAMDVPWDYDEMGCPKDPALAKKFADQEVYIADVRHVEEVRGKTESPRLLDFLQDPSKQRLMTAMRLYLSGKEGLYSNLFSQRSLDL